MVEYTITSRFGGYENFRNHGHTGIDFAMVDGTPLRSIKEGTVYKIVDYGSQNAGKCIQVQWDDGKIAIYGHLSKFANLKVGDHVQKGELLGYSGHSGNVYSSIGGNGAHLHFGLKTETGSLLDPSPYISDIEHMNDKTVPYIHHVTQIADSSFHYNYQDVAHSQLNIYGQLLHSLKLNFIHLFNSVDYSIFIHHLQSLLDLFFR